MKKKKEHFARYTWIDNSGVCENNYARNQVLCFNKVKFRWKLEYRILSCYNKCIDKIRVKQRFVR